MVGQSAGNTIAVLDDDQGRRLAMQAALADRLPQYLHVFFDNAPDMIAWLSEHMYDLAAVSLDHDLGPNREREGIQFDPGTGRDVAEFLATQDPRCSIIIATTNSIARPGMELVLQDSGWCTINVLPFSDLSWIGEAWIITMAGAVEKRSRRSPQIGGSGEGAV